MQLLPWGRSDMKLFVLKLPLLVADCRQAIPQGKEGRNA